ncbi:MAG: polysaccharide biosynthesis protein [Rhodothermia bacterium]|nr:polysaccharide biosynthesis protein [Rhodothermia bacterium]
MLLKFEPFLRNKHTKFLLDLVVWSLLTPIAAVLRVDNDWVKYQEAILWLVCLALPLKALAVYQLDFHLRSWHKMGIPDLMAIIIGVTGVTALVFVLNLFTGLPRSIPVIEGFLAVVYLGGLRLLVRLYYENRNANVNRTQHKTRRVIVVGAGEAGNMVMREMLRKPMAGRVPIGFVDDASDKQYQKFLGKPVLGKIKDIPQIAKNHHVDEMLIAMPSQRGAFTRQLVEIARKSGLEHKIMPGINELLTGRVSISSMREIDLDDLLRRDPIRLDVEEIRSYITGKTILVTGAGGSIGSEVVRQVALFDPKKVILLGRGENSIYLIEQEVKRSWPELTVIPVIADVRNREKLETVFQQYRPQLVFHAAAHKHVPLMEANPDEAMLNNVGGTKNLVELGLLYQIERFVNISTDKAVNPTSVMGSSKRLSEYLVARAAGLAAKGQSFVSVRFGNVLGSRGSVVPLFKEQIKRGGPITVTHPGMTRYFMTIPEATQLVLQAGSMNGNGNVYVLDMGEPVRIVDLAKDLIMLSGLEPDKDIPIVFSGLRPGEKLFEELLTAEEGTYASRHEKIFVAKNSTSEDPNLMRKIETLFELAKLQDGDGIREVLHELIPTYTEPKIINGNLVNQ